MPKSSITPVEDIGGLSRHKLVTEYVGAIADSNAALFLGAGLSRESGYVDWKRLMRGAAQELGLDLAREQDLVAVAQYYLNLSDHNRHALSQMLVNEFGRRGDYTDNHRIIGRLPIRTIWTTNFDKLIERALEDADRVVDVKRRQVDLTITQKRRDVILYKMHGDVLYPDEIVICKQDYERYARDHPAFQTALEADLVAKTFLFLGFSFADPNLNYMLGHLRTQLEANQRQHFAIMRRARQRWQQGEDGAATFEYESNKQRLLIRELARYGIRTCLVDSFKDVTDILRLIEKGALSKNVFVSGSADKFADGFDESRTRDLCMRLGQRLVVQGCKLISGFGLNIGAEVVKGAILALHRKKDANFDECIVLRPFPREMSTDVPEREFLEDYRRKMVSQSGIAIFLSGTSRSNLVSAGVMDEYRIARAMNKVPIPIGATGFAAREIWIELREEREEIYDGRVGVDLYDRLNDSSLSCDELIGTVFQIMDAVDG